MSSTSRPLICPRIGTQANPFVLRHTGDDDTDPVVIDDDDLSSVCSTTSHAFESHLFDSSSDNIADVTGDNNTDDISDVSDPIRKRSIDSSSNRDEPTAKRIKGADTRSRESSICSTSYGSTESYHGRDDDEQEDIKVADRRSRESSICSTSYGSTESYHDRDDDEQEDIKVYEAREYAVKAINWYELFSEGDNKLICACVSWQGYAQPTYEPISYIWQTEAWFNFLKDNDVAEDTNPRYRRREDGIIWCEVGWKTVEGEVFKRTWESLEMMHHFPRRTTVE